MTMLEDRVRRALRETAEEISPLDVPPLRPPSADGRSAVGAVRMGAVRLARRAVARPPSAGWPGWLTPLAAAAAVAAVLAGTLTLADGLSGHRPRIAGSQDAAWSSRATTWSWPTLGASGAGRSRR